MAVYGLLKRARASLADESGQSIILIALSTFFLLAILAIVAESTLIYIQRRDLQNAADSAALAGAQRLPEEPGFAVADAQGWATKNISDLLSNQAEVFDQNLSIRATVTRRAETMFSGRFSFGSPVISAHATARVRSPQLPGPGVVPLSISDDMLLTGLVTLKEWAGNNGDPRSSYQLLDLPGGNGANSVCDFLIGGSVEPITDPVDAKAGNVSSLHNCLVVRMDAAEDNGCLTYSQVTTPSGELIDECNPLSGAGRNGAGVQPTAVVVVPVVTGFCQGACDLDIVGSGNELRHFAYFLIDLTTVETVNGVGPTCAPPGNGGGGNGGNGGGGNGGNGNGGGNGTGQCWITGRFLRAEELPLTASGVPVADYSSDAVVKVVQLID